MPSRQLRVDSPAHGTRRSNDVSDSYEFATHRLKTPPRTLIATDWHVGHRVDRVLCCERFHTLGVTEICLLLVRRTNDDAA